MSPVSVRLVPRQSYNGGKLCIPSAGSNVSRNVLSELYSEFKLILIYLWCVDHSKYGWMYRLYQEMDFPDPEYHWCRAWFSIHILSSLDDPTSIYSISGIFRWVISRRLINNITHFIIGTGISVGVVYPVSTDIPLAQASFTINSFDPVIVNTSYGSELPSVRNMFTSPPLSIGLHTLTIALLNTGNLTLNMFTIHGSDSTALNASPIPAAGGNQDMGGSSACSSSSPSSGLHGRKDVALVIATGLGSAVIATLITSAIFIILWRRKLRKIRASRRSLQSLIMRSEYSDVVSNGKPTSCHLVDMRSIMNSIF